MQKCANLVFDAAVGNTDMSSPQLTFFASSASVNNIAPPPPIPASASLLDAEDRGTKQHFSFLTFLLSLYLHLTRWGKHLSREIQFAIHCKPNQTKLWIEFRILRSKKKSRLNNCFRMVLQKGQIEIVLRNK